MTAVLGTQWSFQTARMQLVHISPRRSEHGFQTEYCNVVHVEEDGSTSRSLNHCHFFAWTGICVCLKCFILLGGGGSVNVVCWGEWLSWHAAGAFPSMNVSVISAPVAFAR